MPGRLNWSPKVNWVEKRGGLPDFVERIAIHIMERSGYDRAHAIASAINTVKKWCASGEVHQWPGIQMIKKPGSMPQICKAVAEWEALKGRK